MAQRLNIYIAGYGVDTVSGNCSGILRMLRSKLRVIRVVLASHPGRVTTPRQFIASVMRLGHCELREQKGSKVLLFSPTLVDLKECPGRVGSLLVLLLSPFYWSKSKGSST